MTSLASDRLPLRFGRCELRAAERQLMIDGQPAVVGARAFDVLVALAERRDRVVTKHELLDVVWPHLVVEENNLQVQVSGLRKLLGPQAIATIPGRGYRFTALLDAAPQPSEAPSSATLPDPPLKTNLAERPEPLIGRDGDVAALDTLLDAHPLITVVGPGGIGKTRLAQALLHARRDRYAHGVCWVDLAAVSDAAALPGAIAAALGVHIGQGNALEGLVSSAAPLAVLVALDNAEHLLTAVAQTAQALHDGAPQLRLLVTSQAPLKLPSERLYRLGALAWPDEGASPDEAMGYGAIKLLVERAQAVDRSFALTPSNVAAAVALCRQLDGLALAIELAAARVPLVGLANLTASLDQRLRLLGSGARLAPARQQTLRAALEWSHALLSADERAVFRRLGVFAGGCSLELVQRVLVDDADSAASPRLDRWQVLDALGNLIDRSLVHVTDDEPLRYRLLETPRAFALDQLEASHELSALRQRHAQAIAAQFDAAWHARWDGSIGVDAWMAMVEPDIDNGRKAFAWSREHDPDSALAIFSTLLRAIPASLYGERVELADAAKALLAAVDADAADRAAPSPQTSAVRARARLHVAWVWGGARVQRAPAAAARAVQAFRHTDDRVGLYLALALQSYCAFRVYDLPQAEAALTELQALEEPGWPPQLLTVGMVSASGCVMLRGASATEMLRTVLVLNRAAGDSGPTGLARLVDAEIVAGELDDAVRDGQALIEQLANSRHASHLALARVNQFGALLKRGELGAARAMAQTVSSDAVRFGLQPFMADYLAQLAVLERRPRAAALLCGHADASYARCEEVRAPTEAAAARQAQALARAALGDAAFEPLQQRGARLADLDAVAIGLATGDAS